MAAPVINTATSVLEFKQWEEWEYQPFATNSPTSWAAPNLPTGLSINSSTGKISGAAEVAGIFVIGLTATNGDGTSTALVLTIGILAAPAALTSAGYEVEFDLITRQLKLVGGTDALSLFVKRGDDILIWLRLKKGDAYLDLGVTSLSLVVKEFAPDQSNLILCNAFLKKGSGSNAVYGLTGATTATALKNALSGHEADDDTRFNGRAEIEMLWTNPDAEDFGPDVFRTTSRTFAFELSADMVEAAT